MDVKAAKQALHEIIDRIEDNELLTLYVKLLERELRRSGDGFFNTSDMDLVTGAETSLKLIEEGNVRSVEEFKKMTLKSGRKTGICTLKKNPMNEIIFLVEESPEGGYEAKALGYSIFTDGDTMEELKQNVREAVPLPL